MRADGVLHVDRVLADPLAVPRGLDQALRRIERGAREQRDVLAPLAARPDAAEPVRAAAQQLERFLENGDRSPLLRALRRPLRQIAPGTPGWRNLDSAWKGLKARAEAAVELQAALDGIRAAVARVRDRFADELPRASARVLRREQLDEDDLVRIARAEDVKRLHARLRRAEHELERLWERVDGAADAQLQRGQSWAEEAAPGEVLALLRLRERERLLHERDRAQKLRGIAARQVQALGSAGANACPRRDASHAVAERLGTLLLRDEGGTPTAEDLALWSELLGAASDALHQPERAGWAAHLDPPPVPVERDFGATHFIVPIDPTYALVTQEMQSCVRVAGRAVTMDGAVECAVFLEPGDVETLPLARMDVEPLFDGLNVEPAWYATGRRAKLRIIARYKSGWIARIERRGELVRSRVAAWQPERGGDDRLRVLGTLSAPAPAEPLVVGPAGGEPYGFCGLVTLPVATPLAECATGWLRLAGHGAWSLDAVKAEEACFRAVARKISLTVPVWAGRGHLEARGASGPLYVQPLGLRAAALPPLASWLTSAASRPLLQAVARLWLRITQAGYALGVYHTDALVFTMDWTDGGRGPAAHATVTHAPFAAPLGQYHRRPPAEESLLPHYAGLGCGVLPPAAAYGDVALPASEVQAFALFALDALVRKPLSLSGIVASETLVEMVPRFADHFVYPEPAARLAAVLRPGAKTDGVASFIQRMAGE